MEGLAAFVRIAASGTAMSPRLRGLEALDAGTPRAPQEIRGTKGRPGLYRRPMADFAAKGRMAPIRGFTGPWFFRALTLGLTWSYLVSLDDRNGFH